MKKTKLIIIFYLCLILVSFAQEKPSGLPISMPVKKPQDMISGKVILPHGFTPKEVAILVFRDVEFSKFINTIVVKEDGSFSIELPAGEYYLEGFLDINRNNQTDQGDRVVIYGKPPEAVSPGEEITFDFTQGEEIKSTTPTPATTTPSLPTPTPTPHFLKGRVINPAGSPQGAIIEVYCDQELKELVSEVKVESKDGWFYVELPEGNYFLKSYLDINSNGKLDSKDLFSIYGGSTPQPVSTGITDLVLLLEPYNGKEGTSITSSFLPPTLPGGEKPKETNITTALPGSLPLNSNKSKETSIPPLLSEREKLTSESIEGKVKVEGTDEWQKVAVILAGDKELKNIISISPLKGADGEFSFSSLKPGKYYLIAFYDANNNQLMDTQDIISSPKEVTTGEEGIKLELKSLPPATSPTIPAVKEAKKDFNLSGKVFWPGQDLSRGIIEVYKDVTLTQLVERTFTVNPEGEFYLKLPGGKYFITVAVDLNQDGNIGPEDGIGIYGLSSVTARKGEIKSVLIKPDKITSIKIPVTDRIDYNGNPVQLNEFSAIKEVEESSTLKPNKEHWQKLKHLGLKGKLYYVFQDRIYCLDFSNWHISKLAEGVKVLIPLQGSNYYWLNGMKELCSSSGKVMTLPNNCWGEVLSPSGKYLACMVGEKLLVYDLKKQKEVYSTNLEISFYYPASLTWYGGDEELACLYYKESTESASTNKDTKTSVRPLPATTALPPSDGIFNYASKGSSSKAPSNLKFNLPSTTTRQQGGTGFYLINIKNGEKRLFFTNEQDPWWEISASPYEKGKFLYVKGEPPQIWSGKWEKGNWQGGERLTVYGGKEPSISPDSKFVVYSNNNQFWLLDLTSKEEIPLVVDEKVISGKEPKWSE